jgi:hypothetical protein
MKNTGNKSREKYFLKFVLSHRGTGRFLAKLHHPVSFCAFHGALDLDEFFSSKNPFANKSFPGSYLRRMTPSSQRFGIAVAKRPCPAVYAAEFEMARTARTVNRQHVTRNQI